MLTKEQIKISKIIAIIENKAISASMSQHSIAEKNKGKAFYDLPDYKYHQGKCDVLNDILSAINLDT